MEKVTVKELREFAKSAGIKGYSRMKKAELEEALLGIEDDREVRLSEICMKANEIYKCETEEEIESKLLSWDYDMALDVAHEFFPNPRVQMPEDDREYTLKEYAKEIKKILYSEEQEKPHEYMSIEAQMLRMDEEIAITAVTETPKDESRKAGKEMKSVKSVMEELKAVGLNHDAYRAVLRNCPEDFLREMYEVVYCQRTSRSYRRQSKSRKNYYLDELTLVYWEELPTEILRHYPYKSIDWIKEEEYRGKYYAEWEEYLLGELTAEVSCQENEPESHSIEDQKPQTDDKTEDATLMKIRDRIKEIRECETDAELEVKLMSWDYEDRVAMATRYMYAYAEGYREGIGVKGNLSA